MATNRAPWTACDRCTQGVMDADNPHHPSKLSCPCDCHDVARAVERVRAGDRLVRDAVVKAGTR